MLAKSPEKKPYPRKNSHLALFAAWEFASQGKRTLIFSTQANWVESYGKQVVDLCKRGYLDSLLEDEASIARALEVGRSGSAKPIPPSPASKRGSPSTMAGCRARFCASWKPSCPTASSKSSSHRPRSRGVSI